MDGWFKWNMFFTSFLPLWFSIVVSDVWSIAQKIGALSKVKNGLCLPIILQTIALELITITILLLLSVAGVISICCFISGKQAEANANIGKIIKAKRANKLSAEFLLAYILPMIAFDFSSLHDVILFLLYFAVLSFLCIRNNNVYTNFLFEAKGYRMYECDVECQVLTSQKTYENSLIISKNKTLTNSLPHEIRFFDFDNYIYIDLGVTKNG